MIHLAAASGVVVAEPAGDFVARPVPPVASARAIAVPRPRPIRAVVGITRVSAARRYGEVASALVLGREAARAIAGHVVARRTVVVLALGDEIAFAPGIAAAASAIALVAVQAGFVVGLALGVFGSRIGLVHLPIVVVAVVPIALRIGELLLLAPAAFVAAAPRHAVEPLAAVVAVLLETVGHGLPPFGDGLG